LGNHETQNIYLHGCVTAVSDDKIRRRPRSATSKKRSSYVYTVTIGKKIFDRLQSSFCWVAWNKRLRLKRKYCTLTKAFLMAEASIPTISN